MVLSQRNLDKVSPPDTKNVVCGKHPSTVAEDDNGGQAVLDQTNSSILKEREYADRWTYRSYMKLIGNVTIGVGVTALLLPSITASLAGFGSGGIVVGSKAAAWQSAIGGVVAGSLFAKLQGMGASGLFLSGIWKGAATVAGGAVTAAASSTSSRGEEEASSLEASTEHFEEKMQDIVKEKKSS